MIAGAGRRTVQELAEFADRDRLRLVFAAGRWRDAESVVRWNPWQHQTCHMASARL